MTTTTAIPTAGCSFALLQNFTQTATGIQTTGQSSLLYALGSSSTVQSGSYIVFSCVGNLVNVGGSLNVTCNINGSWSQFPQCVSNCNDIPFIANGYSSNATAVTYSNNTYQRKVCYTCNIGYVSVNTPGQSWVSCTNGVWGPLPVCTCM